MPSRTALQALLGLVLLAQSACASSAPWPPPPGSCIEADLAPGRRTRWRYRLQGQSASRAEVERAVDVSPEVHAGLARGRRNDVAGTALIFGGAAIFPVTGVTVLATQRGLFGLMGLAYLPLAALGASLVATHEEPFHRAVAQYNARMARDGLCTPPKRELPPPHLPPPPPGALPTLPSRDWTP